jgi:hypothetical protein
VASWRERRRPERAAETVEQTMRGNTCCHLAIVVVLSMAATSASIRPGRAVIAAAPTETTLADPRDWPSTLLIKTSRGMCSATVIGPRVILTAGYCIGGDNLDITAALQEATGAISYRLQCQSHPNYETDLAADVALCAADKPLAVPRIEQINTNRMLLAAGASVIMVGYGCRSAETRNFDGRLSAGQATFGGFDDLAPGLVQLGGSVACSGDSGGGVFSADPKKRVLLGIISRTDLQTKTWIVRTDTDKVLNWARGWARSNNALICGLDSTGQAACTPKPAPALSAADQPPAGLTFVKPAFAPVIAANINGDAVTSNDIVQVRQITYRKNEILADVVQLSCPDGGDENYLLRALQYLTKNGQALDRDFKFSESGRLEVPACPDAASRKDETTVEVKETTTLWKYYTRLGDNNPAFSRLWAYEPKADEPRISPAVGRESRYFVEAFRALNSNIPDLDVYNLRPGQYRLPLRPRSTGQQAALPPVAQSYDPIGALQRVDESCDKPHDLLTYPVDVAALLDVLEANGERQGRKISNPGIVVIVDSGLYAAGIAASIFPRDMLYRVTPGMIDPEFKKFVSTLEPRLPNPIDRAHGTWVASLALGGPLLARILGTDTGGSRIQIDPYPLYEARGQNGKIIVPAEAFVQLIERLSPSAAGRTIVNLSLRTKDELLSVKNQLTVPRPNFLFVVAAGNGQGGGADIQGQALTPDGASSSYPASYGGPSNAGRNNLLAVAALYRDQEGHWKRAPFSDYGPGIVEIGAPGCAIPVMDYDPDEQEWAAQPKLVSGTSFSAALVSFTAALLSAEYRDFTVPEIKQRILAAADLNPGLVGEITDGRSLNVAKALDIYHDVIETATGTTLRGSIEFRNRDTGVRYEWNQNLEMIQCLNFNEPIVLSKLLKIVPSFNRAANSPLANQFPDKVYVARGEGRPEALDCVLPDELQVYFTRHGSDAAPQYPWASLRDVLLRIPAVRNN